MKVLLKGNHCCYCGREFTEGNIVFIIEDKPYCGTYCATKYLGQKLQQVQEFEQSELERN